jgi:hypothetical protein
MLAIGQSAGTGERNDGPAMGRKTHSMISLSAPICRDYERIGSCQGKAGLSRIIPSNQARSELLAKESCYLMDFSGVFPVDKPKMTTDSSSFRP